MTMLRHLSFVCALLGMPLLAQAFPQDLIAVTFTGNAVTLDSRTGVGQVIGTTGRSGHNCMGRAGATLYTIEQVGTGTSAQRFLNQVDDVTGLATRTVAISRDLRGLAAANATTLYAVADNAGSDQLVRVSTATGGIVVVGSTGFANLQGLTRLGSQLYGWDLVAGLITIDPVTGAGTDVNPGLGIGGAGIQFLNTMVDGRVIGGQNAIYEIDVTTGVPTLRGSGAYTDLRGAEERYGVMYTFGTSCGPTLDLLGVPQAGTTITTRSTGNGHFAPGLLFVGFSDRNYQGLPLPLLLDGLLGTVGCIAYAGPEISFGGVANGLGVLTIGVAVPAGAEGLVFHVQHVVLSSSAPGGLRFSEGGSVRVQL